MGGLHEARSRLTACLELYLRDPATHHERLVLMVGMDSPAIGVALLAYADAIEGWPERASNGSTSPSRMGSRTRSPRPCCSPLPA